MEVYRDLGFLIFGSRLRRISESYLSEISKVYQSLGIEFEPSWFLIFYLLSEKKTLSIRQISNYMEVSHAAISQLISNLRLKGLVETEKDQIDGRKQLVRLSEEGESLLSTVLPVWKAIELGIEKKFPTLSHGNPLLKQLREFELAFSKKSLSQCVLEELKTEEKLPL